MRRSLWLLLPLSVLLAGCSSTKLDEAPVESRNVPAAGAGPVMSLQPDGSRPISTFTGDHRCAFWAGLAS